MLQSNGRPTANKPGANKAIQKKPVLPTALPTSTKTPPETLILEAQDDALNALFSELGL